MRNLCHFVPVLALALSGCFLVHNGEPEPGPGPGPAPIPEPGRCSVPDGMVCCSFRAEPVRTGETDCPFQCPPGSTLTADWECGGAGVADGGVAPPPVPLPRCPPTRADWACFDDAFAAPVGTPFELPVQLDTCACCAETECVVEADDASRTLRLTTALCPDPCDCDACFLPVVECEVPPLREGDWTVVANGAEAFTLPVTDEEPFTPPACATFAQEDSCALDERIETVPFPPEQICVAEHRLVDRAEVSLVRSCPDCAQLDGPCNVALHPRFTDDLPPGGDLHIDAATGHTTDCDVDCPAVCVERTQRCISPRLNDGEFYRVFYDGRVVGSFTAGTGAASCTLLDPPVPG